jgi:hypothetical protein
MGKGRILVVVPTRGRPDNVRRLETARLETHSRCADFLYALDDDDPERGRYLEIGLDRVAMGPRLRLVGTLNQVALKYADRYPWIGFMGDDHLPRTEHWDTAVQSALDREGPAVVYGDDRIQGANLPTAVFMPSRVVTALGFFAPPVLTHLYADNFWLALGQALGGLVHLPDVVIEHLHPVGGTAPWDDRYAEVNAPSVDTADRAAWEAFVSDGRFARAVDRVKEEYGL